MISANITASLYLVTGILFIMALRGLSSPETSRTGNFFGILGMTLAIIVTLLSLGDINQIKENIIYILVPIIFGGLIGGVIAFRVSMTAMPQLVAGFHSLVGLSAVLVGIVAFYNPSSFGIGQVGNIKVLSLVEMSLGVAIGAITFSGSCIAFLKLQGLMSGNPITFKGQHLINLFIGLSIIFLIYFFTKIQSDKLFWAIIIISILIGFLIIIPIGGADMPVVVSMLNSYSGWAAAGIGFTLENIALIITGALVGSSGAILSYIMCKAMNRSIVSVLLGGFGADITVLDDSNQSQKISKSGSVEDVAFLLSNADSVIIVPGYGLAVARAQHALQELTTKLISKGIKVKYAIHPVAGRMPGHMNVLLAEADVPYEMIVEMEDINNEFGETDVVLVIGANDVVNPQAKKPGSPIYGMPILEAYKAKTIIVNKRSMSPGYAGLDNELFYLDKTMMVFGDAKKVTDDIVKAID